MVPRQRAFARLRLRHRNTGFRNEIAERLRGLAHQHAAARHDQRALGAAIASTARARETASGSPRRISHTRF